MNLQIEWSRVKHVRKTVSHAKEDKEAYDIEFSFMQQVHRVDVKDRKNGTEAEHGQTLPSK